MSTRRRGHRQGDGNITRRQTWGGIDALKCELQFLSFGGRGGNDSGRHRSNCGDKRTRLPPGWYRGDNSNHGAAARGTAAALTRTAIACCNSR